MPPKKAVKNKSNVTRQLDQAEKKTFAPLSSVPASRAFTWPAAKYRSTRKTVIMMAAMGTYLAETSPLSKMLVIMEPRPMPMVKVAMKALATVPSASRMSLVKTGNCTRSTVPRNQNHEAPMTAQKTSWRSLA